MNYGFKLPEIVRFADRGGHEYDATRLTRATKMQVILSEDGHRAAGEFAREMRKFDVYCLPFDECYFELVFQDARFGYLCWSEDGEIFAKSYQWWGHRIGLPKYAFSVPHLEGVASRIIRPGKEVTQSFPSSLRLLELEIEESNLEREHTKIQEEMLAYDLEHIDIVIGSLSLGGATSSQGSTRAASPLTRSVPRPFFSHSVISVPLDRERVGRHREPGSPRSPVRLHWRRGHIRRLPNGNLTKVKPSLIGDRRFGAISSEYIVHSKAA